MRTIGIFSKLGMPGGSENRVVQMANSFSEVIPTYIFAEKLLSDKLKPKLYPQVILRENTVTTKQYAYELSGVDALIVVNSDSYSFCKPSYWDGTQGEHHHSNIDISQIPSLSFLFNYVVSPAQWLYDLHKINPRIKIMTTCQWFIDLLNTESKFKNLRSLNLPIMAVNSPVSSKFDVQKTESTVIRINRHSMPHAYKHDFDNVKVVDALCKKYGDRISFEWVGVPDRVRNPYVNDKDEKSEYKSELKKYPQMKIVKEYSIEITDLLSRTDILFFYISRFRKEPWPRTIAEGMMAGCCCVTNDTYGMKEQIVHGKTGYLFKDTDEAIQILSGLIDNPKNLYELRNAAKEYAQMQYLDSIIRDKMLTFSGN